MSPFAVSIVICTRDRAAFLQKTLASLEAMAVPEPCDAELLVVDNGSSDETAAVIDAFQPDALRVRALREPRPGKSHALNTALRGAHGEVLLFTDDDVHVPRDWIAGMTRPIIEDGADAVAGGVKLAAYLDPAGMTPQTRAILAETDGQLDPDRPARMVGANMAVHRRVFEVIPEFDTDLGPGQLGFEDDTLLSLQMHQAGLRIAGALDVVVDHHPDSSRAQRSVLRSIAERIGRSEAYVGYHWRHQDASRMRSWVGFIDANVRLVLRRLVGPAETRGLPDWEHRLLRRKGYHRQMLVELQSDRAYRERFASQKQPGSLHD